MKPILLILFISQIYGMVPKSRTFVQFREDAIIDEDPIKSKDVYATTECCLECERTPNCTFAQTVTDPSGVKTTCSLFGEITDVCSYLEPREGGVVYIGESKVNDRKEVANLPQTTPTYPPMHSALME